MNVRLDRAFSRVTERFQLNPSNWLPHLSADGLYEMGYTVTPSESPDGLWLEGERVPVPCMSLYSALWLVCYSRREKCGGKASVWELLWGFLSGIDIGVYDTTNWVVLDLPGEPS